MKIITTLVMLLGITSIYANSGSITPPCNCGNNDQVNIYAAGVASIEGGNTVRCTGETGTCWEVEFKPGGGWIFTIYLPEQPIIFSGGMQDGPPTSPVLVSTKDNYRIYEWDSNIWKQK